MLVDAVGLLDSKYDGWGMGLDLDLGGGVGDGWVVLLLFFCSSMLVARSGVRLLYIIFYGWFL